MDLAASQNYRLMLYILKCSETSDVVFFMWALYIGQ